MMADGSSKVPPLVSVLIPAFNHERYVERCLDSVLEDPWPAKELVIIDDGKGFDPLDSASGMGLRIMRFRAQLIGGFLSVESRPGAGTTLRCRCPVKVGKEAA